MNYSYQKLDAKTGRLSFTYTTEEMTEAADKAFKKYRGRIRIPGFRPGKAPRAIIENLYGKNIFVEYAMSDIMQEGYEAALKDGAAEPIGRPHAENEKLNDDGSYTFDVDFPIIPEAELGEYLNLDVEYEDVLFDEKSVDRAIEADLRKHMRSEEITDRPAALDDIANIDYAGTIDGVAFDGGTATGAEIELGKGSFVPGFEEQIVGMNIGEEKDIDVVFPDSYVPQLAGKAAVFHIKLNGLRKEELPVLNDEFVEDTTEFTTVAEYRADMEKKEHERVDAENAQRRKNAVFAKAAENATLDLSDEVIEIYANRVKADFERQLAPSGMSLEDYVKMNGMSMEMFKQYTLRMEAMSRATSELVLDALIEKDNPEVTDEMLDEKLEEMAKQYNKTKEEFSKVVNMDMLRRDIQADLVLDKMVATAHFHKPEEPQEDETAIAEEEVEPQEENATETASEEA